MLALLSGGPPERENWQKISIHQVRFAQASRDVHSVILLVVQLQPPLDIAQARQSIVSQGVAVSIFAIESSQLEIIASARQVRSKTSPQGTDSPL